ncbi:MAG: hypothetical protein JXQ76_11850, partial [Campylobacterales bacterium]|nr:hypothetical protein [Campylobacterales bacterium]
EVKTTNMIKTSLQTKPLTASFIQDLNKDIGSSKEPNINDIQLRLIDSGQEDIASFEIETADWLMIKPTSVELYAVIRYKINNQHKSQIVPIVLQIQPPVLSIIIGSISGGALGHLVRQLTLVDGEMMSVSLLAVIMMSFIAAIILSKRDDTNKGFVTLEDFFGAFFIGTMIGYIGTEYFENILNGLGDDNK